MKIRSVEDLEFRIDWGNFIEKLKPNDRVLLPNDLANSFRNNCNQKGYTYKTIKRGKQTCLIVFMPPRLKMPLV